VVYLACRAVSIEIYIQHIEVVNSVAAIGDIMEDDSMVTLGFVCVQNAGRSQMSTAFAERERDRRGLENNVEIITGGTHPADSVHEEVVTVMQDSRSRSLRSRPTRGLDR